MGENTNNGRNDSEKAEQNAILSGLKTHSKHFYQPEEISPDIGMTKENAMLSDQKTPRNPKILQNRNQKRYPFQA